MNKKLTWEALQKREWEYYSTHGPVGVFSVASDKTANVFSRFIADRTCEGQKLLDVGCGCLEMPEYLRLTSATVYGIDPFAGDKKRQFIFKQGVAEKIPFDDNFFDVVTIATSLDHFLDPGKGIRECYRVLSSNGKLLIWYSRRYGKKYEQWKRNGGLYNPMHQWAFSDDDMNSLLTANGFTIVCLEKNGPKARFIEVMKGKRD